MLIWRPQRYNNRPQNICPFSLSALYGVWQGRLYRPTKRMSFEGRSYKNIGYSVIAVADIQR